MAGIAPIPSAIRARRICRGCQVAKKAKLCRTLAQLVRIRRRAFGGEDLSGMLGLRRSSMRDTAYLAKLVLMTICDEIVQRHGDGEPSVYFLERC